MPNINANVEKSVAASKVLENQLLKRPCQVLRLGVMWNEKPNFLIFCKTKTAEKHGGCSNNALKKIGPLKSGKTMLLKNLRGDKIDEATITVRTNGVSLYTVRNAGKDFELVIREIGGSMAPIWHHHLDKVYKIIYVIDASNLCQISAAGVLLYTLLVEPRLQQVKLALVLTKMDLSYRQMRNEALLMLHFSRLQNEVRQEITVFEASGVTGQGVEQLREWIFDPATLARAVEASRTN